MPTDRHLLYAAGLFLIVVMLGGALLMWPSHRQIRAMRAEIIALNAKVSDMDAMKALAAELNARLAELQETIDRELKVIPESANVAELMRRLSLRVDEVTVYDQTFTAGTASLALPDDDGTVRLMPLSIDMAGAFDAVFAVIQAAESMDRLLRVSSVRLSSEKDRVTQSGAPFVTASIKLDAIYDTLPPTESGGLMTDGSSEGRRN